MSTVGHGHLSFPKAAVTVSRTAACLFPPRRHRHLVLLFPKRSPTSLRFPPSFSISNTLEAAKPPSARPAGTSSPSNSFLFDVSGMMCGGCSSRVKSILSSDDRVLSAAVNLLTETAAVKLREGVSTEAANALVDKLTECGFPSRKRSAAAEDGVRVADGVRKWREVSQKKEEMLVRSRNRVAFAWTLVALCCGSHASHVLHSLGIHGVHGKRSSQPIRSVAHPIP